jgi:hypothetical protein
VTAKQIQQLPELRAQSRLACGPLTQHGGKAIIEKHWLSHTHSDRADRAESPPLTFIFKITYLQRVLPS